MHLQQSSIPNNEHYHEVTWFQVLCDSNDDNKAVSVMSLICDTNKTALPMTRTELVKFYIILR